MDYANGSNIITSVLIKNEEGQSRRRKCGNGSKREKARSGDAVLLASETEEEAVSQGTQAVFRRWGSRGNGMSSRASRRDTAVLLQSICKHEG